MRGITVRVADAYKALMKHVNDGMEFPEAETRVQGAFDLTNSQSAKVRAMYDNSGYCQDSPEYEHEADFESMSLASGYDVDVDGLIFDVNCRHCGTSGAFRIDPKKTGDRLVISFDFF